MKKIIIFLLVIASCKSFSQSLHPAKWTFSVDDKKEGATELVFKIKLENGWHIYSQYTPEGGPLPMLFTFETSGCYSLEGKVSEPAPVEEFDSTFSITVFYLEKEAELRQKIKTTGKNCAIKGSISYQACKDVCIAFDTTFVIKLGKVKSDKSQLPAEFPVEGSVPGRKTNINALYPFINTADEFYLISSR